MNVKSKYDPDESESKPPKKQFMFLGYGNYNSRGGAASSTSAACFAPHIILISSSRNSA